MSEIKSKRDKKPRVRVRLSHVHPDGDTANHAFRAEVEHLVPPPLGSDDKSTWQPFVYPKLPLLDGSFAKGSDDTQFTEARVDEASLLGHKPLPTERFKDSAKALLDAYSTSAAKLKLLEVFDQSPSHATAGVATKKIGDRLHEAVENDWRALRKAEKCSVRTASQDLKSELHSLAAKSGVTEDLELVNSWVTAGYHRAMRRSAEAGASLINSKDDKKQFFDHRQRSLAHRSLERAIRKSEKSEGTLESQWSQAYPGVTMPGRAEGFVDLWSDPELQPSRVRMTTDVVALEGGRSVGIQQKSQYSIDNGNTWKTVITNGEKGVHPSFNNPSITARSILSGDPLPVEWLSSVITRIATDQSSVDPRIPFFRTGELKDLPRVEQVRADHTRRILQLQADQSGPQLMACFANASAKHREALESFLSTERVKADPLTERQEGLLSKWEEMLTKGLTWRSKRAESAAALSVSALTSAHLQYDSQYGDRYQQPRTPYRDSLADSEVALEFTRATHGLMDAMQHVYGTRRIPESGDEWATLFEKEREFFQRGQEDPKIDDEAPRPTSINDMPHFLLDVISGDAPRLSLPQIAFGDVDDTEVSPSNSQASPVSLFAALSLAPGASSTAPAPAPAPSPAPSTAASETDDSSDAHSAVILGTDDWWDNESVSTPPSSP